MAGARGAAARVGGIVGDLAVGGWHGPEAALCEPGHNVHNGLPRNSTTTVTLCF